MILTARENSLSQQLNLNPPRNQFCAHFSLTTIICNVWLQALWKGLQVEIQLCILFSFQVAITNLHFMCNQLAIFSEPLWTAVFRHVLCAWRGPNILSGLSPLAHVQTSLLSETSAIFRVLKLYSPGACCIYHQPHWSIAKLPINTKRTGLAAFFPLWSAARKSWGKARASTHPRGIDCFCSRFHYYIWFKSLPEPTKFAPHEKGLTSHICITLLPSSLKHQIFVFCFKSLSLLQCIRLRWD